MGSQESSITRSDAKRRLVATLLCPLGALPLQLVNAWDTMAYPPERLAASLWDYVGFPLVTSYLIAAPTGIIVWFILRLVKAPLRAWLIIPVFVAIAGVVGLILFRALSGLLAGLVFGLPAAVAYCLIAGTPWKAQKGAP